MQFTVKKIKNNNIKNELLKIGFDESYIDSAVKKHSFYTFKIEKLPFYCATIIKEAALSNGCDAGIHKGVLNHSVEISDVILSGTIKQLEKVYESLSNQPFGLSKVSKAIKEAVQEKEYRPQIMGILNITEDSFSDGGNYLNPKNAIEHAKKMMEHGADIIDIGAEATNPKSTPITYEVEIERLKPVIKEIKKLGAAVSIDTRNSKTADFALNEGADIINDVSGLQHDNSMIKVIKNSDCKYILMHSVGEPNEMDNLNQYENIADDIYDFLKEKTDFLEANGVKKERIIADVGFGFAKDIKQNFELLKRIKEFNSLGVKTLAGVSRKRFLKSLVNNPDNEKLDSITSTASFYLFENKINIIRVHNVELTRVALDLYNSIY